MTSVSLNPQVRIKQNENKQYAAAPQEQDNNQAANVDTSKWQGMNEKTKAQNTAAFKGLDNEAQQIITSHFEKKSWTEAGGYGDMNKIAADLNAHGYKTKVGTSDEFINNAGGEKGQGVKYLEITDKNGKTIRLWDANGDGGFGGADLDFNASLANFNKDLANGGVNIAQNVNNIQGLNNNLGLLNTNTQQFGQNNAQNALNPANSNEEYKNYLQYMLNYFKGLLNPQPVDDSQKAENANLEAEINPLDYELSYL